MCTSLFSGGKVSTPEVKQVAPSATTVTSADIGADSTADTEAARKRKQKQGYAATRLADVQPGTKSTLG